MRNFSTGMSIYITVVVVLATCTSQSRADVCEYFESQENARENEVSSEFESLHIVDPEVVTAHHELDAENLTPVTLATAPSTDENWFDGSKVKQIVFIQSIGADVEASEKIESHSSMPIFGKRDHKIDPNVFRTASHETVDLSFDGKSWESGINNLDTQLRQMDFADEQRETAAVSGDQSDPSAYSKFVPPMILIFFGLLAAVTVCFRRIQFSG